MRGYARIVYHRGGVDAGPSHEDGAVELGEGGGAQVMEQSMMDKDALLATMRELEAQVSTSAVRLPHLIWIGGGATERAQGGS